MQSVSAISTITLLNAARAALETDEALLQDITRRIQDLVEYPQDVPDPRALPSSLFMQLQQDRIAIETRVAVEQKRVRDLSLALVNAIQQFRTQRVEHAVQAAHPYTNAVLKTLLCAGSRIKPVYDTDADELSPQRILCALRTLTRDTTLSTFIVLVVTKNQQARLCFVVTRDELDFAIRQTSPEHEQNATVNATAWYVPDIWNRWVLEEYRQHRRAMEGMPELKDWRPETFLAKQSRYRWRAMIEQLERNGIIARRIVSNDWKDWRDEIERVHSRLLVGGPKDATGKARVRVAYTDSQPTQLSRNGRKGQLTPSSLVIGVTQTAEPLRLEFGIGNLYTYSVHIGTGTARLVAEGKGRGKQRSILRSMASTYVLDKELIAILDQAGLNRPDVGVERIALYRIE